MKDCFILTASGSFALPNVDALVLETDEAEARKVASKLAVALVKAGYFSFTLSKSGGELSLDDIAEVCRFSVKQPEPVVVEFKAGALYRRA
jgi:hypothetical protein